MVLFNPNTCIDFPTLFSISGMVTAKKVLWARCFWPTLFCDFISTINMCERYQCFAHKAIAPPTPLHPIIITSPFFKWGIDFMTCNPASTGNHKYIIVAVDYFTKWAEAMPTYKNTIETVA